MNDRQLETLLLASRPYETGKYSHFTQDTMSKIRMQATFSRGARTTNTPTKWSVFMKYVSTHKAIALVAAAVAVSLISFSSYAYANGTNPYSLLKRWITGESVHVSYQGREFQYGKGRTYSDAAVTAFAELSTIDRLVFQASDEYTIPKNGIEHINNPYKSNYNDYIAPWIGVVEQSQGDKLIVHQQYQVGDKLVAGKDLDNRVTIASADAQTYIEGEPARLDKTVGKLVIVYSRNYLRYPTGSKQTPQPVVHQFVFALNHKLDDFKEANQDRRLDGAKLSTDGYGIYETSWTGSLSDLCINNTANHCDRTLVTPGKGESFFACQRPEYAPPAAQKDPCEGYNPSAIRWGEASTDDPENTRGLIIRHVEGKVTAITDSNISLKTSSGQTWTLALTAQQREDFNKHASNALKVGDRVGATVVSSVNDLDNRTFDNTHIYTMKRY